MKQKLFLTLVMLLTVCSFSRAKEAYAVYDSGDQTLTFRYDDDWGNQPTSVYKYKLNTGSNTPGWIAEGKLFKRVIFISSFADYRPTSTYKWFYNQTELTTFTGLNYLKTNNVTNMGNMFSGCTSLTSLNLNGWNTSNVKNMNLIFYNCRGLTSLNLSSWNTGNVEAMGHMFNGCSGLTSINISGWNTENVEYMEHMFNGCSGLTSLNISGWNTGKVHSMSSMFKGCSGLTSLDVSGFNTANVTDMSSMFYECKNLTSLNLSSFNTANVTNMSNMFYKCSGLTSLDISNFNTANVTDMSFMFFVCSGLTSLDISNFNTANVTDMSFMFFECTGLTSLDLSSFDTSNVTSMAYMFVYCRNLKTIYAGDGWNTDKVDQSGNLYGLFYECNALVGGKGTSYTSSHIDKEYARIDGGPTSTTPGYFTIKVYDLKITDTSVTSMNKSDVLGNGKFSYSPSTKTLTVKGSYKVTGSGTIGSSQLIRNNIEGLTIDVIQDAILECEGILIWLQNNTTIKGNGKLTLKSGGDTGIYLSKSASATIENMDIVISSMWGIAGPLDPVREKITIKSSNITITTSTAPYPDNAAAICDLPGGIILEDCSITYPTNARLYKNGVYSGSSLAKDVTITAKVGISTGLEAIENGQLTIDNSNDSWYTIDGQKLSGKPAKKGIYIQNGKKRIIK